MSTLKDKCAIVGIGETAYVKQSPVSTLALAAECSKKAIQDAGLTPKDIDGVIVYWRTEPLEALDFAATLGIPRLSYELAIIGGGTNATATVATAAAAIHAGLANNVLCMHASCAREGARGRGIWFENFRHPFGLVQAPQTFAVWAQRHMKEYGTKPEHFGEIAISLRHNASMNERAIMRTPITMEDYLKSRWVTTPFRLLDCCLDNDGGVAVVVSSAERAKDMKHRPVYIMGAAANAWGPSLDRATTSEEYCSFPIRYAAPQAFAMAGVAPKDIDFAQLYDCFTYTLLSQIEDCGFCKKGEGGPFVEAGHIRLGGQLPVNTSGGQLSEAHTGGWSLINEGVRQLRGDCGPLQVKDAEIGLVTSVPHTGSALILRR